MDDKNRMQDLLLLTKGACDLYMHGSIESNTSNIHSCFDSALDQCLQMQSDIYKKMEEKGWYPAEKAEEKTIQQVKQKYQSQASM